MRHQHERRAGSFVQIEHDLDNGLACFRIEISGRLIGKKDFRAIDESAGERDPLLLAAGKLSGIMRCALGETDAPQQFESKLACRAITAQLHRHDGIFQRGQGRDQLEVLKDKSDGLIADARFPVFAQLLERNSIQQNRSGTRAIQSRAQTEKCRFPAAGRTEDRARRALRQSKRDIFENGEIARARRVNFCELLDIEHWE